MVQIINLNKRRKAKQRQEKEQNAKENRINYGRTKHERLIAKQEQERADQRLDGHKLETNEKEEQKED
jgi:hypothetical protein